MISRANPPWLPAALLAAAAVAAGFTAAWHLRHSRHPLLDLAPWAVPTFRMVLVDGTLMRAMLSSVNFLLPLLFQLGFGYDAFHAGLLVLVLFAGNLGIKPMTTWVLRRFGFRTTIVGNFVLQAATMFAIAALTAATPLALILPLLVVSGASRSTQFTALGSLVFADVAQDRMAPANTWYSVSFQLSIGLGVALGALILRLAGVAVGSQTSPIAFHAAFAAIGVVSLLLASAALRLQPEAGAAVSGHKLARA